MARALFALLSRSAEPEERFTIRIEPAADGGVIHFDWDTTRVSAPFKVVP